MKTLKLSLTLVILSFAAFSSASAQRCFSDEAQMAGGKAWFINNEPVSFKSRTYQKYGLPRVLAAGDVVPIGAYNGAQVSAEPGSKTTPDVIYIVVSKGCEYQPYQIMTPPCIEPLTIYGKPGKTAGRAAYIFYVDVPKGKTGLTYQWQVKIEDGKYTEIPGGERNVIGSNTSKMIAIATRNLPKKSSIVVTVSVGGKGGECVPSEKSVVTYSAYRLI